MWSTTTSGRESRRQAEIACHSCRRRKVKCDRGYPQCSVCENTDQVCNYPSGPAKPGPKLGSSHRQKKRSRVHAERQITRDTTSAKSSSQQNAENIDTQASHSSTGFPRSPCSCGKEAPERTTPSAAQVEWNTKRDSQLNINDLSFILHPSHEAPTPEKDAATVSSSGTADQQPALKASVCAALGVDQSTLDNAIQVYFDNMVAINLFHEPSFREKINSIASASHLHALLAALLAYAARFYASEACGPVDCAFENGAVSQLQAGTLLNLAFSNIDNALKECGDDAPPLCVLQALIVATHCQLTQGVRGKAWRSLGMCIRLAYELNLHLVDAGHTEKDFQKTEVYQWCEDEEKRRAWWAIWEMDVFASTIRRTPPAVDWSQIETLLPVEDQDWFQNRPSPTCFMERDPVSRWKVLQECGNQSSKAWFLVVNSLMKEAQVISSPRSIPSRSAPDNIPHRQGMSSRASRYTRDPVDEATKRLELLANSVHCFTLALPAHLQYRNQYLAFGARAPGQMSSPRQLHCGIYNIYVMTQLARLMIYRYDVFGGRNPAARRTQDNPSSTLSRTNSTSRWASSAASNVYDLENLALARYFEATDNILTITSRSSDDHIRHINPFLSSTIWLASAVQLLRMEFYQDNTSRTLIKSKFEILHMIYKKCVSFWDVHTALQQNLEALEAQLDNSESSAHGNQKERRLNSTTLVNNRPIRGDNQPRYEAVSLPMSTDQQMDTRPDNVQGSNMMLDVNCDNNSADDMGPSPTAAALETPPPSVQEFSISHSQGRISRQQQQQRQAQGQLQQTPLPFQNGLQRGSHPQTSNSEFASGIQTTSSSTMRAIQHVALNIDRKHQQQQDESAQPPPPPTSSTGYHTANSNNPLHDLNNNNNTASPSAGLLDPLFLMGQTTPLPGGGGGGAGNSSTTEGISYGLDFGHDWRNIDLPSDIHDLLSGFSTY